LKKLLDDIAAKEEFASSASTAKAPPLLKEGSPVAPLATVTVQLLNVDSIKLKLVRAALLAYTAPPPPFASPGRADDEFENTEHRKKRDFDIRTVTLDPLAPSTPSRGSNRPVMKLETWAE
jgi:hypothetical protein